jgi:hypothetical protein
MLARGDTLRLPRGAPLVQALPIKRDEFQSEIVAVDADQYQATHEKIRVIAENKNFYKQTFWQKKAFR